MINYNNMKKLFFLLALILIFQVSCSTKKTVKYSASPIPKSANLAIIIDSSNNIKNVVLAKFLSKGFKVKAINASDLYTLSDIFDIKDLKRLALSGDAADSLISMEKTYSNIYKLHIYNFEINKAALLNEIKSKLNVQYIILLDIKDWEEVSWGRAINLGNYEITWLENYPAAFNDTIDTVLDHFIDSMAGKK